jgi:Flp pilus assembly protein TadG
MAIVTPLLLLLVLGIVQFGILFNNYITLTDAVRAGARQAAVSRTNPDPVGVTTTRVRKSAAGLDGNKLTITVTPYDPATGTNTWAQGGDVTVKATYPFKVDIIGLVVHSGNLESETTERVE